MLASLTVLTLSPSAATAAPQVRLSPAAGAAGGVVVLDGSGFPAARRVRVGLAGHRGRPLRATAAGTYQARLTVPGSRRGWVTIVSRSRGTRIVSRFFAAAGAPESVEFAGRRGRLRITPATLLPGATAHLHGLGYRPHRHLRLSWAGVTIAVTADRRGRFVADIAAASSLTPGAWPGLLTGRGVRLGFNLQVLAPPAPAPPAAPAPPPPPPPPPGPLPVAVWHMDDAAGSTVMHDAVGGHDGTMNAVAAGVPGFPGTAFVFARSFVTVPSAPALNPGAANLTLTIHLRTTRCPPRPTGTSCARALHERGRRVQGRVPAQRPGVVRLHGVAGLERDHRRAGAERRRVAHGASACKTPTAIALVVDGQTFSQAAGSASIANSADLVIGARPGSEFFIGSLDEASVVVG